MNMLKMLAIALHLHVSLTRMDHLGAMLQGDLDDLVASEISSNRSILPALANDVGLISLCNTCVSAAQTPFSGGNNRSYSACAC